MIEAVAYGVLVPFGVAAGITWLLQRQLRDKTVGKYLTASGMGCGFLAAYALVADGEWIPARNWHWLPYLAVVAAIVGPMATAGEPSNTRRGILFLLLSIAAATTLVPHWAVRPVQIPGFAVYLLAMLLLVDPLPQRVAVRSLLPLLYLCALATAAFVAAKQNLNYGQIAGVAAAAFAGNSLVFWMRGNAEHVRGLLPTYVILLAGVAYVGCIYPTDPIYGLLIAPAAPIALSVFCCGPLSRLQGVRRTVGEWALVLMVLLGSAILLFAGSIGEGGSEW